MFTLAHLTDPHLGPLPEMHRRDLASKRLLGYVNWQRNRSRSFDDQVVAALIRGLQDGRYVPGQRLIEADLTKELKVSRGPVREALKRLAAEGLVSLIPHRGAYIRALTRDEVHDMLGRYHFISGDVVEGHGRGRELGFPTANIAPATELLPADGIYATLFHTGGQAFPSVSSIGRNPTFGGGPRTVETFVLDFDRNLYGAALPSVMRKVLEHALELRVRPAARAAPAPRRADRRSA